MNREAKLLRRKLRGALAIGILDSLVVMTVCLVLSCWAPNYFVIPIYCALQISAIWNYWLRTRDVVLIYGPRQY